MPAPRAPSRSAPCEVGARGALRRCRSSTSPSPKRRQRLAHSPQQRCCCRRPPLTATSGWLAADAVCGVCSVVCGVAVVVTVGGVWSVVACGPRTTYCVVVPSARITHVTSEK